MMIKLDRSAVTKSGEKNDDIGTVHARIWPMDRQSELYKLLSTNQSTYSVPAEVLAGHCLSLPKK